MLRSHQGYDIGALELARLVAGWFGTVVYSTDVTRLLVDLNRSEGNPGLFSAISRRLPPQGKEDVVNRYYLPYRREVESEIGRLSTGGRRVLHISAHSFTPVLDGKVRSADIGLLYDPGRAGEASFCKCWKTALKRADPTLNVRLNYPYSGKSDGFTAYLRSIFGEKFYLGIELEVNQKYAPGKCARWLEIGFVIVDSLELTLRQRREEFGESKPLRASRARR